MQTEKSQPEGKWIMPETRFTEFLALSVDPWERLSRPASQTDDTISIFHVCMVWIEKSVTRVTDRHHEACRVMPNSDPE